MQLWLGRPSGHSVYYTLIGTFETEAEASAAFGKLVRKYGKGSVRHKEREVQVNPADEVWEEDELDSDKHRLENYGAVEIDAIENFWDFEVAFNFDTPSASEEEVGVLMLLKYPELAKYMEYLDKWVEHTADGKTKYHLGFRGSANDVPDVYLSSLFYHRGYKKGHEFLGLEIGTDAIPECELISCC